MKGKDEVYNEWEFAEQILLDKGFREKLCLVASQGEEIVGYCIMTDARIEDEEGLALGPVAVKPGDWHKINRCLFRPGQGGGISLGSSFGGRILPSVRL